MPCQDALLKHSRGEKRFMAAQDEGIHCDPSRQETGGLNGHQDINPDKEECIRLQNQMESLRSLNNKLVTQVALLRQSSNSPRAVDCAPLSSPSVVSLASSFESIDAEADDDAVDSPREDNRTWKTKLMDFLSQVEALAHQGCEMLDRVRTIDARIKEVLPNNTPTRKELRQRKGLKVQELLGTLCDIQIDIDLMKVSLKDDCEGLVEFVKADLVGVVNALRKSTDENAEGKELAKKKLGELEGQLEQVECERNDALSEAVQTKDQLTTKIEELEQELSGVKEELEESRENRDEASNERDALEARLEETAFLEQERDMAQVELLELREEKEQLELRLCSKESEQGEDSDNITRLEQKISELERSNEALLAEREEVDAEASEMRGKIRHMEATVRTLEANSKSMETRFVGMSATNDQLVMEVESLRKQLEEAETRCSEVDSEAEKLRGQIEVMSGDDPESKSTCRMNEEEKEEMEMMQGNCSEDIDTLRERVVELEREVEKGVEVSLARDEYREKMVEMMSDMEKEIFTLRAELNNERKKEAQEAEKECWAIEVESLQKELKRLIDEREKAVGDKAEAVSNAEKEIGLLTTNLEHCRAVNGRLKEDNRIFQERIDFMVNQLAEKNERFDRLQEENVQINSSNNNKADSSRANSWKGLLEELWASRNQLQQAKLSLSNTLESKGALEMKVKSLEARLVNEKRAATPQDEVVASSESGDLHLIQGSAQRSRALSIDAVARSVESTSVSLRGVDLVTNREDMEECDMDGEEVTSGTRKKSKWRVFATTFGISGLVAAKLVWGMGHR
ncbi:hypothetical protein BSKO_11928 [Bryopsis sp. KO-2023]|nr:hypothetical protein BSKO_11928 [Bryopsis sp. KO-2023]